MHRRTSRTSVISGFFRRADLFLLTVCTLLTLFGIVAIASVTDGSAKNIIVQTVSMFIGIAAFVVFTVIDPDLIADKWVYLAAFSAVFIIGLLFFGQGDSLGNKAWYRFMGIGVQPSEIVKVIFIVLLAKQLSYYKERRELDKPKTIALLIGNWLFFFGLIFVVTSDLGSALIYMAIFIVIMVAGGVAWYWLGAGAALGAAMIPLAWKFVLHEYQRNRILAPYDMSIDPNSETIRWQTTRTMNAMKSGRWSGVGLGNGRLNIEAKHTDCIFASIGEEMGMIACLLVLLVLIIIIVRCCVIGLRSGSTFGMLICFGVAASMTFQTFINIGMCMGISPVIGITLPFVSYGGSSIVAMFASVGLVSGVKYRPKPVRHQIAL
ncbi:MAG: FtsW/RodA/SpoVE family cell cycle protein [Oscillospiraceae bacterium]|nr:FtsW/RodA/SpoVE family cell cycle protein [Oscillospiraceae bacterium]